MRQRIAYIDKLKGMAIIFLIMGHVVEKSLNFGDTPTCMFIECDMLLVENQRFYGENKSG